MIKPKKLKNTFNISWGSKRAGYVGNKSFCWTYSWKKSFFRSKSWKSKNYNSTN